MRGPAHTEMDSGVYVKVFFLFGCFLQMEPVCLNTQKQIFKEKWVPFPRGRGLSDSQKDEVTLKIMTENISTTIVHWWNNLAVP